jgi:hypothetical protein
VSITLKVYDHTVTTLRHTFAGTDVEDLQWSDEVAGAGAISFTVPGPLMPTNTTLLDDCVVVLGIDGTDRAIYAVRGGSRSLTIGATEWKARGVALLQSWGRDAVIRPEYATSTMPRSAGEERGLGWMASAYNPATDPIEPWDLFYVDDRTQRPTEGEKPWPTGTSAKWCSARDPEKGERKLFRTTFTVTEQTLVRVYFSADETSNVWLAGENVISTDSVETGKKTTHWAERLLAPGDWAVAVDSVTHVSVGGDGVDPFILGICSLTDDADEDEWLLESRSGQGWRACRRAIVGPGSTPPGLTPGGIALQVVEEAQDRGVTSFTRLTTDFSATHDSDGTPWSVVEERVQRYSFDTYLDLFDGLGDVACDMRITPGRVLQARVFEGRDRTGVRIVPGENVEGESETLTPIAGNVVDAYTKDGWLTESDASSVSAYGRREYALSLGTAPSLSQGQRIAVEDLTEASVTRLDGDIEFIAQTGCTPYADFRCGDTVTIARPTGDTQRRILSLAGKYDGAIHWSAELGEAFK